jgi:hypothetical protein
MHCRESVALPMEDMHIASKQRFKDSVISGSFDAKRPGRYPLMFMRHVAEYYGRQLSYSSDVLHAMRGILRSFQEQSPKRVVHNISGIPVLPGRIQGFQDKAPSHQFLVNLFWHHTKPGHRSAQFPSWSWAGWQGGAISPETFIEKSEEYSELDADTTIWIEEGPGLLRDVNDIPMLPNTWLVYQDSRFLLIETRTITCTISNLTLADLPHWRTTPGWYATFQMNRTIDCYAKFHPSGSAEPQRTDSVGHSKQYTGLILPFALAGLKNIYIVIPFTSVLVVEDKGEFYERLGVFHIYFYRGRDDDDLERTNAAFCVDSNGGENSSFDDFVWEWDHDTSHELRRVRLG